MTMQTPPNVVSTTTLTLPEPGYPMLTHVISNALFPDPQTVGCPHCNASIAIPADKSAWVVDQPHPLVPDMTIVRMFVEEDGVEIYAVPKNHDKPCTRSFVPMSWLRLGEEVMPLDVFVEQLAETVSPGSSTIARMVSNSFSEKMAKVSCPNCKAAISVPVPTDKIMDDPVVWTVGQPHPHTLSGRTDMKILRIVIIDGVVWIYSISNDGQSGMRHFLPVDWMRFSEEGLTLPVFVEELEKAEFGDEGDEDDEDDEPDDPENPNSNPNSNPNPNPNPGTDPGSAPSPAPGYTAPAPSLSSLAPRPELAPSSTPASAPSPEPTSPNGQQVAPS